MKNASLLVCFLFLFLGCKPESASIPDKLAEAYGISHFTEVNSLEFVFHVQKGEKHVARHWKWFPNEKRVVLLSGEGGKSYHQNSEMTEEEKAIDAQFVNDSYWLLFPFQVKWDRSNLLTLVQEDATSPISQQKSTLLTVQYKNDDGYSPGDAYDLYLSEKNEIIEWTYRKGGGKPTKTTTWEGVMDFNGLKIATKHQDKSGTFKLWFDGIVVE